MHAGEKYSILNYTSALFERAKKSKKYSFVLAFKVFCVIKMRKYDKTERQASNVKQIKKMSVLQSSTHHHSVEVHRQITAYFGKCFSCNSSRFEHKNGIQSSSTAYFDSTIWSVGECVCARGLFFFSCC